MESNANRLVRGFQRPTGHFESGEGPEDEGELSEVSPDTAHKRSLLLLRQSHELARTGYQAHLGPGQAHTLDEHPARKKFNHFRNKVRMIKE